MLVAAPVARLTVFVPVPLPTSGRSVPFVAPIAAAGLVAMTAPTKPEIRMSLRNGMSPAPFLDSIRAVLLAQKTSYDGNRQSNPTPHSLGL
jgi:hypothetical protein